MNIDYKERAKALHNRLSRFINSKPSSEGEDFSDVYDMIDRAAIKDAMLDLEFALFKSDPKMIDKSLGFIGELSL